MSHPTHADVDTPPTLEFFEWLALTVIAGTAVRAYRRVTRSEAAHWSLILVAVVLCALASAMAVHA